MPPEASLFYNIPPKQDLAAIQRHGRLSFSDINPQLPGWEQTPDQSFQWFLAIKPCGYGPEWNPMDRAMLSKILSIWRRMYSIRFWNTSVTMYGSHCTISFHWPGWQPPPLNMIRWWYFQRDMSQCNTLWTGRCPQKLLSSSIHNQTRFCNNSEAMGGSSFDIPPPTTLFRLRMEDPNSVVWVFFLAMKSDDYTPV